MIKLTKLEKHAITRQANPTHVALETLLVPDFYGESRRQLAQYIVDTYILGELDAVKNTVAPHVLDFTVRSESQQLRVTGKIITGA